MDRRSCNTVSHAGQATRAAADLERFASFRRGPIGGWQPAASRPVFASIVVRSLEPSSLEPGVCQVPGLNLSSWSFGLVKWRLGGCQVRAWKLAS